MTCALGKCNVLRFLYDEDDNEETARHTNSSRRILNKGSDPAFVIITCSSVSCRLRSYGKKSLHNTHTSLPLFTNYDYSKFHGNWASRKVEL